MRVTNHPTFNDDPVIGPNPEIFFGDDAVDGAADPFLTAPLGSVYIRTTSGSVAMYVKKADTGATTDWKEVTTAA